MKLREKLGQYDPERPFSSWLYKVTANYCWDTLRRRHTRQDLETDGVESCRWSLPIPGSFRGSSRSRPPASCAPLWRNCRRERAWF